MSSIPIILLIIAYFLGVIGIRCGFSSSEWFFPFKRYVTSTLFVISGIFALIAALLRHAVEPDLDTVGVACLYLACTCGIWIFVLATAKKKKLIRYHLPANSYTVKPMERYLGKNVQIYYLIYHQGNTFCSTTPLPSQTSALNLYFYPSMQPNNEYMVAGASLAEKESLTWKQHLVRIYWNLLFVWALFLPAFIYRYKLGVGSSNYIGGFFGAIIFSYSYILSKNVTSAYGKFIKYMSLIFLALGWLATLASIPMEFLHMN